MRILSGHRADVLSVSYSPDGRWLASAGWDGIVCVWDLATGDTIRVGRTPYAHALAVAFSARGEFLAVLLRDDHPLDEMFGDFGNLAWVRLEEPRPYGDMIRSDDTFFPILSPNRRALRCMAVAGYTDAVAVSDGEEWITVWNPNHRDLLRRTRTEKWRATALAFGPDERGMAAVGVGEASGIYYWSPWRLSEKPMQLPLPASRGQAVAISRDGKHVVGAFDSGLLIWWKPGSKWPRVIQAHEGAVRSLAFSPDGRLLFSSGADGLVKSWDADRGHAIQTFDWQIGDIHCLAVAPDGLTAAAGGNREIVVWDLDV
jgi:WD40 repeat protein